MSKIARFCALAFVSVSGCAQDETLTAYGAAGFTWHLVKIDGTAFEAPATMSFPEPAQIAGNAPCNSFSGRVTVPYPWFETSPLTVTRALCPTITEEAQFFAALEAMTFAEVAGDTLVLSDDTGRSMVFRAGG
jgi:heat shock protein HslJ